MNDLENRLDELADNMEKANEQIDTATQPLASEQLIEGEQVFQVWKQAMEAIKQEQEAKPHIHGPFTFLMNTNHNALRGCQTCGTTWVGLMAGSEDNLVWHLVEEE